MKSFFNKSILVFLIAMLLVAIMGLSSSILAAGTTTVSELWNTCSIDGKSYNVYCVEPGVGFRQNSQYAVGDMWEVEGSVVKKNNVIVAPGTDEYKTALKKAYILSSSDTLLSTSAIDSKINNSVPSLNSAQRRAIYDGIYDLTSIKQTAIWMLVSGGNGKWSDSTGTKLTYKWDTGAGTVTFAIERKMGTTGQYYYSYTDDVQGYFTNIWNMKFVNNSGNSNGYYAAAKELKNKADSYTGVSSEVTNKTEDGLKPDYTNDSYIKVGPIKLQHNSNLTISNDVEVYDQNNSKISSVTIDKTTKTYGTEIYIKIAKNDSMPLKITKVKVKYTVQNSANATWYNLTKSGYQDLIAGKGSFGAVGGDFTFDLDVELIPPIQIILNKVDAKGNAVNGPQFKVEYSNGLSAETKTVTSGKATFTKKTPSSTDSFKATITEVSASSGYKLLSSPIVLEFTYDSGKWNVSKESGPEECGDVTSNSETGVSKITTTVKNKSQIEKITILKADSASSGTKVEGAKFKITLTNIASIGSYSSGTQSGKIILSNVTTDSSGKISLEDLVIENLDEDITIEIEETEAPKGYKKIDGKITVTLKREGNSYTKHTASKDATVSDSEFMDGNITVSANHEITLNIKNVPVMNIGGIVWEDKQTGIKEVEGPNDKYGEDEGDILLSGVEVFLTEGEPVFENGELTSFKAETKTANGGEKVTYAGHMGEKEIELQKGEYLFAGIEKKDNYYVVFKYDGINYITVEKGTENNASKVEEIERAKFNKKFQTIESGRAIAEDGSSIDLYYNSANGKYTLITKEDEENIKSEFVMYAKSDKVNSSDWQNTWTEEGVVNKDDSRLHINCGLTYRFFDLAIGMDVDTAKLTINGKETTYTYNKILKGDLNDIQLDEIVENNSAKSSIVYNLYLYYSDYNYRIEDYITDGIENNISTPDEGGAKDSEVLHNNVVKKDEELRAFVTYKVIIKNQSTVEDAKVNKLAYYYDTNYKFYSAKDEYGNDIKFTTKGTKEINRVRKNYAEINLGENAKYLGADKYRQELYITFEIDRNSEDYKELADNNFECANIVEILSYSTNDGLIDHDSAPGNLETVGYEDDTAEAIGLNITLRENERKITGTVWNDGKKKKNDPNGINGILEDTEDKVNDVIVQLIEVKPIKNESGITKYYEYIWQETRSGSNRVRTTDRNGYSGKEYSNDITENSGMYEFTDFIPGNYIIRFIYGDGSTYDLTDDVKTYNGQDYQSTNDPNYKSSWYNTARYEEGQSVARDNEARRLEVMAYSTMIDNDKGTKLKLTSTDTNEIKETLKNTWMAAETSRINVPVDADDKKTDSPKRTVSFENIDNIVLFDNMNFGLAKRPETKLTLEKHITSLKIVPNGVGVKPIVEAKAKKIEDIVNCTNANGETVELQGVTTGLTAISSTRDNRNFWKVETDIEELAQGATLEVEYTYVIKNDSDEDYLSSTLVGPYENYIGKDEIIETLGEGSNDKDDYTDWLLYNKKVVKEAMRNGKYVYDDNDDNKIGNWLGKFYYTGNKGTSDSPVLSRAETLKEALNEQFGKQSTVGDYFDVRDFNSNKDINMYKDTDGNDVISGKNISTVIESNSTSDFLERKGEEDDYSSKDADWSKTAKVTTVLSVSSNGTIGGNYPSYIAEITKYSNAAGRRNMEATPGNLSYVHSEATDITMNSEYNEDDEFWGESIIISKPTGEDKLSGAQIAVISTISVAILGAGIILIKKFVLKRNNI